jgi:4-nitrophenol 2-monooxygenase / 4-nitrocatechol 4-monooxygenase, reductase component
MTPPAGPTPNTESATRRPPLDKEIFRQVIGNFATGVTVITASDEGTDYGMTASAVCSLSLEPPMLLVCVNKAVSTEKAISGCGAFGVNILHEDQGDIAEHFAGRHTPQKFARVNVSRGDLGSPLLADALARLECRVTERATGGTHSVFMGEVCHAEARKGAPLAYFRGSFGRIEMVQDLAVYDQLRDGVMSRRCVLGAPLGVGALAEELGAERATVHRSLTRLAAEGLVSRDPERGYIVTPITVRVSDETLEARCAVELGVAELTVGRADPDDVAELRRLMEETLPLIKDECFVDLARYAQANQHFHEWHVSLARSRPLLDAYARLTNVGLIARTLSPSDEASGELVEDHRRWVEAYEAGDLNWARKVIREHAERTKATHRKAIESAGGEI